MKRLARFAGITFAYAVFIAVILAGLIAGGYYFRNAFLGKLRQAGDTFGQGEVYDPYGQTPGVDRSTMPDY